MTGELHGGKEGKIVKNNTPSAGIEMELESFTHSFEVLDRITNHNLQQPVANGHGPFLTMQMLRKVEQEHRGRRNLENRVTDSGYVLVDESAAALHRGKRKRRESRPNSGIKDEDDSSNAMAILPAPGEDFSIAANASSESSMQNVLNTVLEDTNHTRRTSEIPPANMRRRLTTESLEKINTFQYLP